MLINQGIPTRFPCCVHNKVVINWAIIRLLINQVIRKFVNSKKKIRLLIKPRTEYLGWVNIAMKLHVEWVTQDEGKAVR